VSARVLLISVRSSCGRPERPRPETISSGPTCAAPACLGRHRPRPGQIRPHHPPGHRPGGVPPKHLSRAAPPSWPTSPAGRASTPRAATAAIPAGSHRQSSHFGDQELAGQLGGAVAHHPRSRLSCGDICKPCCRARRRSSAAGGTASGRRHARTTCVSIAIALCCDGSFRMASAGRNG
jgi:hypothetical protein